MTTDTSEKGLEELILRAMTGRTDILVPAHNPTGNFYAQDIAMFIDSRGSSLYTNIAADTTHTWLDNVISPEGTTIRMYFLPQINIWGL